MSSLELSTHGCLVELVLPLAMIMKVAPTYLEYINILIHVQYIMQLILSEDITFVILILEQIKHTVCGILRVPLD